MLQQHRSNSALIAQLRKPFWMFDEQSWTDKLQNPSDVSNRWWLHLCFVSLFISCDERGGLKEEVSFCILRFFIWGKAEKEWVTRIINRQSLFYLNGSSFSLHSFPLLIPLWRVRLHELWAHRDPPMPRDYIIYCSYFYPLHSLLRFILSRLAYRFLFSIFCIVNQ